MIDDTSFYTQLRNAGHSLITDHGTTTPAGCFWFSSVNPSRYSSSRNCLYSLYKLKIMIIKN